VDAAAARHGAVAADLAAHAGRAEADLAGLQARSQRHGRPESAWCVGGALAAALAAHIGRTVGRARARSPLACLRGTKPSADQMLAPQRLQPQTSGP